MVHELHNLQNGRREDKELKALEHEAVILRKRLVAEGSLDPNKEYKDLLRANNDQMQSKLKRNKDGSSGLPL